MADACGIDMSAVEDMILGDEKVFILNEIILILSKLFWNLI